MARVLIIEDEAYERRALSSFIQQAGHVIVGEAATAREGIKMAKMHRPHIAFVDIRLPEGVDGLVCAKTMLENVPDMVIIILTAYAKFIYAQRALDIGVHSYILKPASPAEIREKIAHVEQRLIRKTAMTQKSIFMLAGQIPSPDLSQWEKPVSEVKAYIDQHYREPLKIKDLSSIVFLSQAYLTRLFREQIGFSIKQYLQIVRLSAAAKALLNSNASVKAIALSVGYNDANYFSIAFRKHFDLTPLDYREKFKIRKYRSK